jgi:DNA-binding NarL/FixJ family response regulator
MSIRVFIADDHAVVRDGLISLLKMQPNIEVIGSASNGREAVQEVERLKPDVVVMDISMPELNGIEATLQIRDACPGTQVIVLSMHSTAEHVFRALHAGARGYLLKESAGAELIKAIRSVQSGLRYLSQKITDTVVSDYVKDRPGDQSKSPLDLLSPREREILQLVVEGKSSAEISKNLFLSIKTVETYRSRLMQKLGIKDIPSLVKFAVQHGLTSLE